MLSLACSFSISLMAFVALSQCCGAHGQVPSLRAGRKLRNKVRDHNDGMHRRIPDEENQLAEILYQVNPQYFLQDHMEAFDELLAFVFDNMSIDVTTAAPTDMPTQLAKTDVPTSSPSEQAFDLADKPTVADPMASPNATVANKTKNDLTIPSTLLPTSSPTSNAPSLAPTELPTNFPTVGPMTAAPSAKPTSSPVLACGMTPELRSAAIFAVLSDVSSPSLLVDRTTPQGRAFTWIVDEDELYICPGAEKIVQRYVLAVMYFSTNGDNWFQCSADGAASAADDCGNEAPFMGEVRFLAPVHECEWAGIECNEKKCVNEIEFELNNLVGTIPNELVNLGDLEVLGMERGGLYGTIPTIIGKLSKLYFLDLDYNSLTGPIPTEISLLTNLEQLDLNDNRLTGDIEAIGTLNKLFFLQLHNNNFHGTVPEEIGDFTELGAFTLHTNDLTGEIPSQVCRLRDTYGGPLITLTADCNPPESPEINCTCCTNCRNV